MVLTPYPIITVVSKMPYKNKSKREAYHRAYMREWARTRKEQNAARRRARRLEVLKMMGGKCVYCGCNVVGALEINHKKGGGHHERNTKYPGSHQLISAILNGERTTEDLELTCRVCNAIYTLEVLRKLPAKWTVKFEEGTRFKSG
jgi:5-methylcytosine-specific restriction endonuclease McrA